MPFTVEDFHDLVRLLDERPEWREELRRLVLTPALLALPEQIAALRARSEQQFQELITAQQHTEARVDALANQMATLTTQVVTLAEAQQRTETEMRGLAAALIRTEGQVSQLTQAMHTLTNDVGELKGKSLEADYRAKGPAYFSRVVRRPHVLTSDELMTLVEDAWDNGILSRVEAQDLYDADVIVRGRLEDGTAVYVLAEVSWGVDRHDIERATQRAAILARVGTPVIPVVAGKRITPAVGRLARQHQVWQLTNGRAVAPGNATTSS